MVNRMKMMSLGRLSLRSKCRKGVGLHLYSTQMRRETKKGVKIVDWCQDFGSRRKFVCQSSAQVPVHSILSRKIRGARPILMLAVKRGVIWQVGRGKHLRRSYGFLGSGGSAG
jgi:hypothetical protein